MMLKELAIVLEEIREPGAFGGSPPFWAEAMAAMPPGPLPFLDPVAIAARRAEAGLSAERDAALLEMAAVVAADGALRQFAWYLHWRVFVEPDRGYAWRPPSLEARLGVNAGMFFELLALEFVPRLRERHRQLGYPESVTAQTLMQIVAYEGNHIRGRGVPGVYARQLIWLASYFQYPFVRLGRLEYQLNPFGGGVNVWKRASDGQVLALADEGARVEANGLLRGNDPEAPGDWTATLVETPSSVSGFPVDPVGRIIHKQVTLSRSKWAPCLREGMTVLTLHIPAGGGMDWDSVTDSLRQALDFFPRYHADRPFAAVVTGTWFMDPQLGELLPRDANPLKFQRAVYLYPVPPSPGGLWFIFFRDIVATDLASLPRETSLQRNLASFLERGGRWHGGGMFLLKDDLAQPREECYRHRFEELRNEFALEL